MVLFRVYLKSRQGTGDIAGNGVANLSVVLCLAERQAVKAENGFMDRANRFESCSPLPALYYHSQKEKPDGQV